MALEALKQYAAEQNQATQAEIGERIGWTREQVRNYIFVLDKIATRVLDLSKAHQEGRVADDATRVTFTFTEGWFRDS